MPFIILAVLIGLPLVEQAILIKVGGSIGFWPTVGLLVLMAFLGSYLLKQQGLSAMRRTEEDLRAGRMPVESVVDSVGLFLAGVLMVLPGLLSDGLALLLLIPPVRHWMARVFVVWLTQHAEVDVEVLRRGTRTRRPLDSKGPVIEGDYHHVEDDDPPSPDSRPRS